jgi:hypothetical protein
MRDQPQWWEWELEFTPHLLKRMTDRGFNEIDLRRMFDSASHFRASATPDRFVITSITINMSGKSSSNPTGHRNNSWSSLPTSRKRHE